jgi:hypothetical protein
MNADRYARTAAQVAVEAVVDQFEAYDRDDAVAVYENGKNNNVPALYLDMLFSRLYT